MRLSPFHPNPGHWTVSPSPTLLSWPHSLLPLPLSTFSLSLPYPPSSPGPALSSLFPGLPPRCARCYGMRSVWSLDILGHLEQTLPACFSLLVPATTQLPPSHAGSPAGPLALTSSAPGISFTPRRWLDLLGEELTPSLNLPTWRAGHLLEKKPEILPPGMD